MKRLAPAIDKWGQEQGAETIAEIVQEREDLIVALAGQARPLEIKKIRKLSWEN